MVMLYASSSTTLLVRETPVARFAFTIRNIWGKLRKQAPTKTRYPCACKRQGLGYTVVHVLTDGQREVKVTSVRILSASSDID